MAARTSIETGIGGNGSPVKDVHQANEEFVEDAQHALDGEKNVTFLEALRTHPKAVGWSVLLSTAIVMEGYDLKLISQMFAQAEFARTYGQELQGDDFEISAAWQAGLSNAAIVGALGGLFAGGWVVDHIGFRKTMMGALTMVMGVIFLQFFSQNLPMLLSSQVLIGKTWRKMKHPSSFADLDC
jgi:MFS transporter, SP family, general alpha glucoside:H+ symporter